MSLEEIKARTAARKAAGLVPDYRRPGGAKPRPTPRLPLGCIHFGAPTGESRPCPSCSGTVSVKLFACAVHGTCSPVKAVKLEDGTPVACCRTCPDRVSPTEPEESVQC